MVGDTADGIPGVPRWGARSSGAVLTRYGHLEQIPRDAASWDIKVRGAKSLVEQLKENEEEVLLYRKLATLREDAPLGVEFDDMRYEGVDADKVAVVNQDLGGEYLS